MEQLPPRRRTRDRRSRGMRGPGVLPRRPGRPEGRSRRERFDALVLDVVQSLDERWHDRLGLVEYVVEEAPLVPIGGDGPVVPLASVVPGSGTRPARLVVFRQPVERRSDGPEATRALVLTVVIEQLAELLGIPPHEVDPRYPED